MPGFRDSEPFDRDEQPLRGFDEDSLAFLSSLGLKADQHMAQLEQNALMLPHYNHSNNKEQCIDMLDRRKEVIDRFIENPLDSEVKTTTLAINELSHALFCAYTHTLLHAPTGSIDVIHEIANMLQRADVSQKAVNDRMQRPALTMEQIRSMVVDTLMSCVTQESIATTITSFHAIYMREAVQQFIDPA